MSSDNVLERLLEENSMSLQDLSMIDGVMKVAHVLESKCDNEHEAQQVVGAALVLLGWADWFWLSQDDDDDPDEEDVPDEVSEVEKKQEEALAVILRKAS